MSHDVMSLSATLRKLPFHLKGQAKEALDRLCAPLVPSHLFCYSLPPVCLSHTTALILLRHTRSIPASMPLLHLVPWLDLSSLRHPLTDSRWRPAGRRASLTFLARAHPDSHFQVASTTQHSLKPLTLLPLLFLSNRLCNLLIHSFPNWRRQWHPSPVLLPEKSHGRRSLEGCSPRGR